MDMYWEILDENPEYRDRKGLQRRPLRSWEKLFIINGTTLRGFRRIIAQEPWSHSQQIRIPLASVGEVVRRRPYLKLLKYIFWLGMRVPVLEEAANHRIVYILTK